MDDIHPLTLELPSDELGGASGASYFHVLTIGKRDTSEYPYTVANEKIASEFGRAIGLRIPEVLLYSVAGHWYCFSHFIRRTESGETVPTGTAREIDAFYDANPTELQGMICFDLFIRNNDRKTDNFIVSEDQKVWLIDHANALFYRPTVANQYGIPRLIAIKDDLSVMFDKPHAFIEALNSWEDIDMWCDRISQIPTYFIQAVIDNLPPEVLNSEEREFLYPFLEERKLSMRSLIEENRSLFPGLKRPRRK
ncbi:MAG TPA: hypothetical protein VLM38_04815 [Blastocatellia bacterium]|nr:hypothetical protein [Blastocatellia bacterium]